MAGAFSPATVVSTENFALSPETTLFNVTGILPLVVPREESKSVSTAVILAPSAQISEVGPEVGLAVGARSSFLIVFMVDPLPPSTQISVMSTFLTHGTVNFQPHFRPVQPQ